MQATNFQRMPVNYGRCFLGVILPLAIYHVGAVLALFCFTWEGLYCELTLQVLTGLGITVGFHRLLTHGAFQTHRWVRWGFAILGGLAGQSHIRWWALMHRMHHMHTDEEGDPHSPVHGFWWSHLGWITVEIPPDELRKLEQRFIPDLLKDHILMRICRAELPLNLLMASSLFCGGWLYDGWFVGVSCFLWGYCFRITAALHITWAVNSVTHTWGYRNYLLKDRSRNSILIALLSFGEGWHENHHQKPSSANLGRRWWEFDAGYQVIRLLEWIGLAWDVKKEEKALG